MKKVMIKFRNILQENILLLILLISAGIGALLLVWKYSMEWCLREVKTARCADWEYWNDAEKLGDHVVIRGQEAYLVDEDTGELLAGPYAGIAGDDLDFSCHIARYVTEDGLIGFIDDEGHVITPAIYTDASDFSEGTARVTDQEGKQYEIDTDGWKVSQGKQGM